LSGEEHRSSKRVWTRQSVSLICRKNDRTGTAVTENISSGGAFVCSDVSFPQGSEVELPLVWPPAVTGTRREIELYGFGTVLRMEEIVEDTFVMAIRFHNYLPAAARSRPSPSL
jgi:PilZ domain-containing protein